MCRVDPFAALTAVGMVLHSVQAAPGGSVRRGKTGESPGRLKAKHTAAFRMSCRAAWSVTTEGAAVTRATDDYIRARSLAGRGEAGSKA